METSATGADVLVVDDDPTVSEVVAAYLRRFGHRVRLAADGPSAVAAAHFKIPDLVVLDLMLPGIDGFEVCRRMRDRLGPVPVIMLTARGEEHDRIARPRTRRRRLRDQAVQPARAVPAGQLGAAARGAARPA